MTTPITTGEDLVRILGELSERRAQIFDLFGTTDQGWGILQCQDDPWCLIGGDEFCFREDVGVYIGEVYGTSVWLSSCSQFTLIIGSISQNKEYLIFSNINRKEPEDMEEDF